MKNIMTQDEYKIAGGKEHVAGHEYTRPNIEEMDKIKQLQYVMADGIYLNDEHKDSLAEILNDNHEEILREVHAENYSGTDDDMADAYEDWVTELGDEAIKNILNKKLK